MRLHSLHLKIFRGVEDRKVEFPQRGVVIVQGPNEVGKTSMMEGLDLLLNEKDSTKKQAVKDVQPVGRDVGVAVTAEISAGEYRFIYSKQWLKNPVTELQIIQPRPESVTGVEAHDRVDQILSAAGDMALFDALRVMQGRQVDVQVELRGNSALRAALAAASGTAFSHDEAAETLVAAIEAEYLKYFTARGNPTGEHRDSEKELADAKAAFAAAQTALREADAQISRHERLQGEVLLLAESIVGARQSLAEHQERFDELTEHTAGVAQAQAHLAAAQEKLRAAQLVHEERATLRAAREQRKTEAENKEQQNRAASKHVEIVQAKLEEHTKLHTELDTALKVLRERTTHLEKTVAQAQRRTEWQQISQRLVEVTQATKRRDAADAALAELKVDDQLLDRSPEADKQVQIAATVLRDSSAQLTVSARESERITVDGAEIEDAPNENLQLAVSEPITLGIGTNITVSVTPAHDGENRAQALKEAKQELQAVLREAEVEDLAAALESNTKHRQNLSEKTAAESQLTGLLGSDTRASLRARVELLERQLDKSGEGGEAAGVDVEQVSAELAELQDAVVTSEEEFTAVQAAKVELQEALTAARVSAATARSEWDSAAAELQRVDTELATAEEKSSTTELDATLTSARAACAQAEAAFEAKQQELAKHDPELVEERLKNSQLAVARLADEHEELSAEINRSRGQLELIGTQGRQEALDEALTALEAAEQKRNRIARQARAAQLLHDTVQRYQQETWQRYVAPFQERMSGLGRLVFGPDVQFEISPDLEIMNRTLAGRTVPFPALSTGAQEQIGILSRLACAQLVSNNGGVPVMIDDALGNSDPTRLEGLGAVLTRAGRDAQVIVLTCTPERYRDVGEASVIRL